MINQFRKTGHFSGPLHHQCTWHSQQNSFSDGNFLDHLKLKHLQKKFLDLTLTFVSYFTSGYKRSAWSYEQTDPNGNVSVSSSSISMQNEFISSIHDVFNLSIFHSFQVLLWVSHRGTLLWPAVLGSSWNGRQGGFQIKHCLFFSFVSIFAQFHTLATLVGESNVSRTTSKPEAHCSHYQQVTFFTAMQCSQLYSCKYQRLLITFINFNQSVSRLTILIMMTALTKEASVKTSLAFNQQ